MQFGSPFIRHTFAPLVSKRLFHASTFNLAVQKLSEGNASSTKHPKENIRKRGKDKALLYASGLGVVSASLYFILVNGPSRSALTSSTAPLSPTHFTPVTLSSSVSCTPYTKLLTLSLPTHLIPESLPGISSIFSIYVKDSDIQIERPYTPLEGINAQGQMHLWVKRYQGGEVGRWLHEREVGEQIEIRGPIPNWSWQDGEWDKIIMISGGTGITPFYQLLHKVFLSDPKETLPRTHFTLLHSSPTPLDLPPGVILDPLLLFAQLHPEAFSLRLFVDTADPNVSYQNLPRLETGRIGRTVIEHTIMNPSMKISQWLAWWPLRSSRPVEADRRRILFLVCGPEPMITAIAGPRARNLTQENVGGVLGDLGFESHQVCKL